MKLQDFNISESINKYDIPTLPYQRDALNPYISSKTVRIHRYDHHVGYFKKMQELIKGTSFQDKNLTDIVKNSTGDIFNNSAQVWNHNFYWSSLTPNKTSPNSLLQSEIDDEFGGITNLEDEMIKMGMSHFGSGWLWLAYDDGLELVTTSNADNLLNDTVRPLLVVDLWEHAYYLDYNSDKEVYLKSVIHNLLNWDFASNNM